MTRSEASGQTKRESPNTPMKGTKKKKKKIKSTMPRFGLQGLRLGDACAKATYVSQ